MLWADSPQVDRSHFSPGHCGWIPDAEGEEAKEWVGNQGWKWSQREKHHLGHFASVASCPWQAPHYIQEISWHSCSPSWKRPKRAGKQPIREEITNTTGSRLAWSLSCSMHLDQELPGLPTRTSQQGPEQSHVPLPVIRDLISRHYKFGSASNLLDDLQHLVKSIYYRAFFLLFIII